jgi:tRNA A-37 threonylcarbamoyl transferase component Bud32
MTDALARLTAALSDRYRIEREIGAGGMATVYLAHDVRHERKVALKVLRPELAAVIGADRFLAEITTTAHLQHAHILGLIDSGTVNGTVFYVMPFVDGETLRDRIDREKQLPVADSVRIAIAIAGALDYAHRRGVIHRDIKPANILLNEGQPFIADFGIALAASRSEARSTRMTETGMSLGTPQYMSPEQAMGERNLDARTDIYSLGCVLYEMLTGEPPFTGPTSQAVVAKVMGAEPEPVTTLRRTVPANVAAATMTALSKVPADRFATAAEFAEALANPQYRPKTITSAARTRDAGGVGGKAIAAAAAIVLLAGATIVGWLRPSGGASASVARFEVQLPALTGPPQFVLRPDGSSILWASADGYWERRLDSLTARRLRDAAVPQSNIRGVSPDGRQVLVGGRGGTAIVPLASGPASTLATSGRGARWAPDGTIYFIVDGGPGARRGIARIAASGGRVDTLALTSVNDVPSDVMVLPGGKALVVVLNQPTGVTLSAFDLDDKTWHPLGISGTAVQFVPPGYLVYSSGQYLMAAQFDVKRLAVTQPSIPIAEAPGGSVERFSVGGNVLAYLASPDPLGVPGIVMRSRGGVARALPNVPDSATFSSFTMSPGAERVAAVGTPLPAIDAGFLTQPVPNIYVFELASGRVSRWRSDLRESSPAWIPGGNDLSFVRVSADSTTTSLVRRPWDASAPGSVLFSRPTLSGGRSPFGATSWLADGRRAIVQVTRLGNTRGGGGGPGGGLPAGPQVGARAGRGGGGALSDLRLFSLDAPDSLRPIAATDFSQANPAVSPDGRLLAYTSNESGRNEVFVRPVAGGALRQVSLSGGTQPKWAHSGRALFYRNADTLYSARVTTSGTLAVDHVTTVLTAGNLSTGYAVGPGDSLFIMRAAPAGERATTASLVVVLSIRAELERMFAATVARKAP